VTDVQHRETVLSPPADFGGRCLVGHCRFDAELLLPTSSYLGLQKAGSYLLSSWRGDDGNLLRATRSIDAASSTRCSFFVSETGQQLRRYVGTAPIPSAGPVKVAPDGDSVRFESPATNGQSAFEFQHDPGSCAWVEDGRLDVSGTSLGPAVQWFNTWSHGACLTVTGKYRASGTFLDRRVEGFIFHEIHYFPYGHNWLQSPYGQGREFCWQHVATEYEDGTTVHGSFAYGADGWGFAALHDEQGLFHSTTDLEVQAVVRPNGYPETIRYRFLDQSWTWEIDPQGERPPLLPGALIGADGTVRRDGDDRVVRHSMGNSDWWIDGRSDAIVCPGPTSITGHGATDKAAEP
jgi:hypothetical protein